jgi:hypothetical protein
MPKPSKYSQLPLDIQEKIDQWLVQHGFSGYRELSEMLSGLGYEISKTALNEYGKRFRREFNEMKTHKQMARIMCDEFGDSEGSVGAALAQLNQTKLFKALMELGDPPALSTEAEDGEDDINDDTKSDTKNTILMNNWYDNLAKLTRAIANLNRSTIPVKKFREEMIDRNKKALKILKEEKQKTGGVSNETINQVEEILGVWSDVGSP